MFALLMRVRLRSGWNSAKVSIRARPLVSGVLFAISLLLFTGIFAGFRLAFDIADTQAILPQIIRQTLLYLFLFLFAGAVPFVSSTLLQSGDYSLLFASPISPRAVVAAKLVDATVTNSLQFSILGIPALVACGVACHVPLAGWLAIPFVIALFALLPALMTAVGLLVLLSIVGMRRLRTAVTLLNAFTGTVVCFAVLSRIGANRTSTLNMRAVFSEHLKTIAHESGISSISPTGWFADIFLTMSRGVTLRLLADAGAISAMVLVLFVSCVMLGSKLLSAASIAEELPSRTGSRGPARGNSGSNASASSGGRSAVSTPVAAILRRDVLFVIRDTILLSQTAMPLILYLVPFILAASDRSLREMTAILAIMMVGIILFMQTSILSLSSIGLEGRAFWITKTSPTTMRTVLWAKMLWSALVSGGISVMLVVFTAVVFGLQPMVAIGFSILFVVCAFGLCGLGVGISASFPKFVYDNPALRVSAWALILGFVASTIYTVLTGVVVLVTYWATSQMAAVDFRTAYFVGGLTILVITATCMIIPLIVGSARMESYPWEH